MLEGKGKDRTIMIIEVAFTLRDRERKVLGPFVKLYELLTLQHAPVYRGLSRAISKIRFVDYLHGRSYKNKHEQLRVKERLLGKFHKNRVRMRV